MYQQLSTFLDLHHATLPVVIRDKLVKLTMDCARSNWSRYSSEIFPWILSLVSPASLASRPASLQLGLVLLLAAAPPENLAATTEIAELGQKMVTLLELCQQKIVASEDSSSHALDPADTENNIPAPDTVMDPAVREVAELVLRCLSHMFSWSSNPSPCSSSTLINVLFQYAAFETRSLVGFSTLKHES